MSTPTHTVSDSARGEQERGEEISPARGRYSEIHPRYFFAMGGGDGGSKLKKADVRRAQQPGRGDKILTERPKPFPKLCDLLESATWEGVKFESLFHTLKLLSNGTTCEQWV